MSSDLASQLPVVAAFCPVFLKPEMWHVYRQMSGMTRVRVEALAFKRENGRLFPFDRLTLLARSRWRWWRRIWFEQMRRIPQPAFPVEVRALREILRRTGARVLHIYFGNNGTFWLPFLQNKTLPVIVSFHGADTGVKVESAGQRRRLAELFSCVDLVLVRSEEIGGRLQKLGCPPDRWTVQRSGVPLDQFRAVERGQPADGRWRVLQAARLIEKKGVDLTIRAFQTFRSQYPQATLTVAGDGPLRSALVRLAAELGVTEAVHFAGFVEPTELGALYQSHHFFVHPSQTGQDGNQEGIPNSLLEAMATGLPCVATRHGGIPEAIQDHQSGLLVEEASPVQQLTRAMEELARSDELRVSLGRSGAATVRRCFDSAVQNRRLEEHYLRLLR